MLKSGLSPNPMDDSRPGHEPQITCEDISGVCPCRYALSLVPCRHQHVAEHHDQSCWTHWGQGTQQSPCGETSATVAGALHPLRDALCISTHHPSVHILAPTQTPVPGSGDHGAVGWLLATSSLPSAQTCQVLP